MKVFVSPIIDNIVLVTALINVIGIIVIFFSCRFVPSARLTKSLAQHRWHKFIYKYHSYTWWVLAPSILVHVAIAILHRLSSG
jgi:hypothetical protein